ncbi:MAG: sigma-70 family RNA polymerase sigma factor [Chthoniobacter sp.]|nr:sigma-70 family RNA polymerase sigma factor [Chthoniobacter sp.]
MPPTDPPDLIALLDRYERPLIRYACSIVDDLDAARDVVQETFIKFAQGGMKEMTNAECGMTNGATPPSPNSELRTPNLEAWLFTVTRNRALDHLRKHRRLIPMELPDNQICAAPGPGSALEQREAATSLFDLLDALSPNQREVIRLKFQNDLSYREIAEVTQLSVTNVGFLLHAGLKKLRALLHEQPLPDFNLPLRSAL